jgi:hypothetical protein
MWQNGAYKIKALENDAALKRLPFPAEFDDITTGARMSISKHGRDKMHEPGFISIRHGQFRFSQDNAVSQAIIRIYLNLRLLTEN